MGSDTLLLCRESVLEESSRFDCIPGATSGVLRLPENVRLWVAPHHAILLPVLILGFIYRLQGKSGQAENGFSRSRGLLGQWSFANVRFSCKTQWAAVSNHRGTVP